MGATTTSSNGLPRRGLPARVPPAPRPTRTSGHRTAAAERVAICLVAMAAGVVGALSTGEPTALLATNLLLRAAFAAAVTLAASRARRWTWLVLSGLAVVGAPSGLWLIVAAAALVLAFVTTLVPRRRIYGALVGAAAAQALLRCSDAGFGRASALVVLAAIVPVAASAYAVSPRRVRRRVHWTLTALTAACITATVLFGVAAALAYSSTQQGMRQANAGLAAVRDGRGVEAADQLRRASDSFRSAHSTLDAWWARPAVAVPFVAQQARAIEVVTAESADVAASAAGSAAQADIQQFQYTNGHVDVARLRGLAQPLATTAERFELAVARIDAVRSPWLVGPLADRIDEAHQALRDALPEVQLAAAAAQSGPKLLGADGPQRYLVLFTQPAEARGLGGFVGNWAELVAIDGDVQIVRSGRTSDLNETPGRDSRTVTAPPVPEDYVARYGRFRPGYYFQDITLSPDFPSVAAAAAQLYPQMGGPTLDGVLVVDPFALAALLKLSGPIRVDGFDRPLSADNAAELLVRAQYTDLGANDERKDFLDQATRRVFDALVRGSLPSPKKIGEVLAPIVEQRRLMFHVFDPGAQRLTARLGIDGAFPKADPASDFFQVVTQNNANNKIDVFLHRQVEYVARYDPASGEVEATMTVVLRNDSPASGLPSSVIGSNDKGLPPGTNRLFFSVYTPLGLREAKVQGEKTAFEYQRELGYAVYSRYLDIAPGASVQVELALFGLVDGGATYRVGVGAQPLVNRDAVTIELRPKGDWEIVDSKGLLAEPARRSAVADVRPAATTWLEAQLARP